MTPLRIISFAISLRPIHDTKCPKLRLRGNRQFYSTTGSYPKILGNNVPRKRVRQHACDVEPSPSVNLLKVVTFITVALLLLICVVVATLRLAALFAFLFWRLGAPPFSLAAADAVRAEVRAAGREVLATATSTLRLVEHRRRTGL